MNKIITEEQIKSILEEIVKLNAPVQSFLGIQKLFSSLTVVEDAKAPKIK